MVAPPPFTTTPPDQTHTSEDAPTRRLLQHVRPEEWKNPDPAPFYHLVVVGGGTAGLVAATSAATLGFRVALVERRRLGGDRLNAGCVPSKAVCRLAKAAAMRRQWPLRHPDADDLPDPAEVMRRVREIRADLAENDSAHRLREQGVDVFFGDARFLSHACLSTGDASLHFQRALLAVGARPAKPAIPGLSEADYLTNETLFELERLPASLAILGGGPMGCEMALAFARLGCEVSLLLRGNRLLPREDREVGDFLGAHLVRQGVRLLPFTEIRSSRLHRDGTTLSLQRPEGDETLHAEKILAATGRVPDLSRMNLDTGLVAFDPAGGIRVDDHLRTSNEAVFAAGDCCLDTKYTAAAEASAHIALQNAFFPVKRRWSSVPVPRCTFTDPEIATVGLTEEEAARAGIAATVLRVPLAEVDRALIEGEPEGFLKILLRSESDTILGATLVSAHAGESIGIIATAMAAGMGLRKLDSVPFPYPTQAGAIGRAANLANRQRLTAGLRGLLSRWIGMRFGSEQTGRQEKKDRS
jgi:pyruvate/2-oxoglutarate dehydrogenase complex dihydrolipoamide dehydrogenase (E3) component